MAHLAERGRRCREQFEQGPDRVANRNNGTRRRCSYVADGSTAGFVVVRVAGGGQRTPRFSRLRWPAGRERVEWAAGSGDAAAHTGEEETMASGGFTMEDDGAPASSMAASATTRWRPVALRRELSSDVDSVVSDMRCLVGTGLLNPHARETGDAAHGSQSGRDTRRPGHCKWVPLINGFSIFQKFPKTNFHARK
jgi:hypothetical protein